ncbi:sensor histidine kinase [Novosphingobium colocasiae]|uniref:histidine kinase n=1 Tax=Novosphingobium colocasiae TaxID=1256513 RepID=A0A918UFA7_9SPHN|nr:HAMP domain-containing sensor histidine kinase [Novosphingobium colocasiae]GGY99956.1 hypothetical protein GCM10011614_13710 [Novosphingobium colocasiae]
MSRLFALRHSIFARIVLWAIVTAAVITSGLWYLTDRTIRNADRAAVMRAVDVDLAGMVDIFASGGLSELSRRVNDRLALQPRERDPTHYMVADGAGRRIAGDIRKWPGLQAAMSQDGEIAIDGRRRAYARATQLGPNLRLLVAHETRDQEWLLRQVGLAFLIGGMLAVVFVALGGWLAAHRLAGRIERINATFRRPNDIALEELGRRAEGKDEIHELMSHSRNALARLDRLAAANRETTDHVAHELRTPLMHLDNRLLRALSASPDAQTSAHLGEARVEIRAIIRMLESLLDIAASETRRGDRHGLVPIDLSALATRLGELYADSAEESGHHLRLQVEPRVTMQGEEMLITRLITNLLDNAFKYVPQDGTVWLKVSRGPVITVSDDGPGIPPAERETVFEKFRRGSGSLSEGGVGLGLALCRAIAARHHLQIKIEPSQIGACFIVSPEEIL